MLSRDINNMKCSTCYAIQVSYQSILKHFHFFYLENKFTTCAKFPIFMLCPFYNFSWVVVSTLTYTHQKSYFSFQSLVGTICRIKSRKFPSDTPGGWFTRLLIERGPMPRCAIIRSSTSTDSKTNKPCRNTSPNQ